jgi:hypothetical protein
MELERSTSANGRTLPYEKLALDLDRGSTLAVGMTLDEEERRELPRALFALAGRRLEYAVGKAMEGEGRNMASQRMTEISASLHEVGQDLQVIADAVAVLAQQAAPE